MRWGASWGCRRPPRRGTPRAIAFAALVAACAIYVGVLGKIARDVSLLMQFEVGEAREAGGGSSAMPHKQNPSGCARALAAAARLPGLAATMLAGLVQEHERAVGAWQAEWPVIAEALQATGAALEAMRDVIAGLTVDPARMRANLDATRGAIFAERVMLLAAPVLGRARARSLVEEALGRVQVDGPSLADAVRAHAELARVVPDGRPALARRSRAPTSARPKRFASVCWRPPTPPRRSPLTMAIANLDGDSRLLPARRRGRTAGRRALAFARPRPRDVGSADRGPHRAVPRPALRPARSWRQRRAARRLHGRTARPRRARPARSGSASIAWRGAACRWAGWSASGWPRTRGDRLSSLVLANTSPRIADPAGMEARRQHRARRRHPRDRRHRDGALLRRRARRRQSAADRLRTRRRSWPPIPSATPAAARHCATSTARRCCRGSPRATLVVSGDADVSMPWEAHGARPRGGDSERGGGPPRDRPRRRTWRCRGRSRERCWSSCRPIRATRSRPASTSAAPCSATTTSTRRIAATTDLTRDYQRWITQFAWGGDLDAPGPRSPHAAAARPRDHGRARPLGGIPPAPRGRPRRRRRMGGRRRSAAADRRVCRRAGREHRVHDRVRAARAPKGKRPTSGSA